MKKPTIVVIDDDDIIARYITFGLSRKGYVVNHFDNGIDGLNAIRNLNPDLVIMDMMMPGLDGREVVEMVVENNILPPNKIIILSGKESVSDKKALFDHGVHDYLLKPFQMDDLLLRVERALEENEDG